MKKLILFVTALFIMSGVSLAGDVSFMWDANTEPDLSGYRLFMHDDATSYDYANPVLECTTVGASVKNLPDGHTYYFVLRAFDTEGFESGNSNEVSQYFPTAWEGVPPASPQVLRFVIP